MPNLRQLLCAALTMSLFLTSGTAEARFGKHSNSDSSSSDDKKEEKHEATPVGSSSSSSSSGRHEASPVGSSSGSSSDDDDSSYSGGSSGVAVIAMSDDDTSYPYSYTPRTEQQVESRAERRAPIMVRLGLTGQSLGDGSALGVTLGLEGKRWGVAGETTTLTLPTDDGTAGEDKIGLYSAHLSYALLSSDQGRLRAEAGLTVAKAPDITFAGPSVALSFERCLFGGLDLEGRGQLVAVPYTQLDAQAGLGLHLGVLTVRAGWRWLLLNDRGLVDGEAHEDVFSGPYGGIGFHF